MSTCGLGIGVFGLLWGACQLVTVIAILVIGFRKKGTAAAVVGVIIAVLFVFVFVGLLVAYRTEGRAAAARTAAERTRLLLDRELTTHALARQDFASELLRSVSPEAQTEASEERLSYFEVSTPGAIIRLQMPESGDAPSGASIRVQTPQSSGVVKEITIRSEIDQDTSVQRCLPSRTSGGRRAVLSQIARAGAMAILVILAYLFIDAPRRRRYTWLVRITAAAAFAAVCVLLSQAGSLR